MAPCAPVRTLDYDDRTLTAHRRWRTSKAEYVGVRKSDGEAGAPGGQSGVGQEDALLVRLIARSLPPEPTLEQQLAAYERVFGALWLQLAPLMSHSGAQTVFARAIQLARRQSPLAGEVGITATALDFAAVRASACHSGEAAQLTFTLTTLAVQAEVVIASLVGPGLARSLLRDVELALARQRQIDLSEHPAKQSDGEGGSE